MAFISLTRLVAIALVVAAIVNSISAQYFVRTKKVEKTDDRIIKIKNTGWYVGNFQVYYETLDKLNKKVGIQNRSAVRRNKFVEFHVPKSVDLENGIGVLISGDAVFGQRIFQIRLLSSPTCIQTWGTTINPMWQYADCKKF